MPRLNCNCKWIIPLIFIALFFYNSCAKPVESPMPQNPSQTPKNSSPKIERIYAPRDTTSLTEVKIECVASDADGDKLTYDWFTDNGTIYGKGSIVTWAAPDIPGAYKINVMVKDGKGGLTIDSVDINVAAFGNASLQNDSVITLKLSLPSAETVVEKKRLKVYTTIEIVCSVDSVDGQLTYSWSAPIGKLQGQEIKEGKASRVGWIAPGVSGDYTVTVTAVDDKGNQAKGQVDFSVFCCGEG